MKNNKAQQNIPTGWQVIRVGSLGFAYNGLKSKRKADFGHGKPYITYMNIFTNSKIDPKQVDYVEIDKSENQNAVKYGDVFFTVSSETPEEVGTSSVLLDEIDDLYLNSFCFGFRLNNFKQLLPEYAIFLFRGNDFRSQIVKMAQGSTRFNLSKERVLSLSLLLPEITEQKRIAEILGTVDEEIAKTQEVIGAAEKLKRGLMQQLFTRGIGHTKFKETKIGQIPEEWGVVSIRNSSIKLIDGDRGANYPKQGDFSPEGFCLFLSAKNVSKNGFIFNEVSFISQEKDRVLRKGRLERGDIILTSRGTVGNVAYYDEKIPFDHVRINSGMLIVRHGAHFDPVFLYRYFSGPQMEAKYSSMGSGSAQPQLPVGSLEQVEIPLMPISEQKEIANIISAVNEKITVNKKLKEKLTILKKGLMNDLLSGRVRVL